MSQSCGDNNYDVNANDKLEPLLEKGDQHQPTAGVQRAEEPPVTPDALKARVCFNVGGVVFQTTEATVKQTKNKKFKLSHPTFLARYYDEGRQEYFFDRDPEVFRSVLNYWRTGHLHLPASMCGPQLKEELDFWGLREIDIEPCCWNSFNQWMQTVQSLKKLEKDRNPSYMRVDDVIDHNRRCHTSRLYMWKLLTDPSHSNAAKIYAYVSLVFVLLAIFSFCASTHQLFDISDKVESQNSSTQNESSSSQAPLTDLAPNDTTSAGSVGYKRTHETTTATTTTTTTTTTISPAEWRDSFSSRIHPSLLYIDMICLVFFTVEYLIKFLCASPRRQFVTSLTAVFDLLAILPDYIELLLYIFFPALLASDKGGIIDFMPFLRLMRAFRIFRLIRRVPGLWIMMYTLKASFKELSLMLVFLLVGTLLFASIIFFVDDPKIFSSIPHGFWWAIVTMTTVGYGDMAPVTAWGQIVGSVTAICGVLIVGFTIPSLVNNFITYYNHVEFVVQKEHLLKLLAEEDQYESERKAVEEREWVESREEAKTMVHGPHGNGGSIDALNRGAVGGVLGYCDAKDFEEQEDASQLYPHQHSYGIPLTSFHSLSKQRIGFADGV